MSSNTMFNLIEISMNQRAYACSHYYYRWIISTTCPTPRLSVEVKGDETPSVEIGTVHDDSDDFEEHLHDYVVDVGSDGDGVDIGVSRDFGEYHHDDGESVHTLAVHAPYEDDQGPGPSQRRPIGDYIDMFQMIHTHYPGLMSSLCLPEDDLLTFDQKSKATTKMLKQIMGLIKAESDRAEREMEMIGVQEIGDQVPEAGGRKQIEDGKLKPFKEVVVTIIHQYFSSNDIPELIRSIEDLGAPEYKAIFVKTKSSGQATRKPVHRNPVGKGASASRKMNPTRGRQSPKKHKSSDNVKNVSKQNFPPTEVFPSAKSKNSCAVSGSVVSQKPSSKKI
ncbi:BnaA10g03760D [Brassica napus]|uniref:(rape) hypothetical protein n=1 Tax=Brassica napus TaxID=3708 RepID=A0A078I8M6_BRANA|nr:unnamed protein product [Brassica napus]CDY47270.1 BnaA10g03760D [Brassica napus]